jgi:hypothetical protein
MPVEPPVIKAILPSSFPIAGVMMRMAPWIHA